MPPMPLVRPYRESDWDEFLALDIETGLMTLRYASEEDRAAFRQRWATVLRDRYGWTREGPANDRSVVYVIEDDEGRYAGHLWLREREEPMTGAVQLWVQTVAIEAHHRSRGWGRLLMERAEAEAVARGIKGIALRVDADNVVARKLYEEMGYQTVRLRMIKRLDRSSLRPKP